MASPFRSRRRFRRGGLIAMAVLSLIVAAPLTVLAGAYEGPTEGTTVAAQLATPADSPVSALNIIAVLASIAITFITWQVWTARPRIADAREVPTTTPPSDLHPVYAGLLASGRVRDSQLEAVVLELVRIGAIALEPDMRQRTKVQVRILDWNRAHDPMELKMLELLEARLTDGVVSYRNLSRLRNGWDEARVLLQHEVAEAGWINTSEMRTRLPYLLPGSLGLALSGALIVAAIIEGTGWPVLGALIVGVTSALALSLGSIAPQTTIEGERAAVPWRSLRTGLAQARDGAHGEIDLDRLFPYITAMGLAASYDRYLRRAAQSGYIPAWIGRRARVQEWPEGWHTYWIALHTALAPTDPANTTAPEGSPWRRSLTGGRF